MINILREISPEATMEDMVYNLLHNIRFYVKNRNELAEIPWNDSFLEDYVAKLEEVIKQYKTNSVPSWFKDCIPYQFTSGNFPYVTPYFPWLFSFKDYVDVLLDNKGEIISNKEIKVNGKILTYDEWVKTRNNGCKKFTK